MNIYAVVLRYVRHFEQCNEIIVIMSVTFEKNLEICTESIRFS